MGNLLRIEDWEGEVCERILSRDLERVADKLIEDYHAPLYVYDETNRSEFLCTIEDRDGRAWIQPFEDGVPVKFRWR